MFPLFFFFFFFFFQAEDGIRDPLVTGVQTCALPISAQAICDSRARLLVTRIALPPSLAEAAKISPRTTKATLRPSDRKSTRLNSSHEWISYAVFCLKKKMCGLRREMRWT